MSTSAHDPREVYDPDVELEVLTKTAELVGRLAHSDHAIGGRFGFITDRQFELDVMNALVAYEKRLHECCNEISDAVAGATA
jgi:hypothetical protein